MYPWRAVATRNSATNPLAVLSIRQDADQRQKSVRFRGDSTPEPQNGSLRVRNFGGSRSSSITHGVSGPRYACLVVTSPRRTAQDWRVDRGRNRESRATAPSTQLSGPRPDLLGWHSDGRQTSRPRAACGGLPLSAGFSGSRPPTGPSAACPRSSSCPRGRRTRRSAGRGAAGAPPRSTTTPTPRDRSASRGTPACRARCG